MRPEIDSDCRPERKNSVEEMDGEVGRDAAIAEPKLLNPQLLDLRIGQNLALLRDGRAEIVAHEREGVCGRLTIQPDGLEKARECHADPHSEDHWQILRL